MISVEEAIQVALSQAKPLGSEETSITEALGSVLFDDVRSDVDMPPFDKSSMDGFALRAGDVENVPAVLDVVGFIPAGKYPDWSVEVGQAAQIMTGAPMPAGTDSVQMVEKTQAAGDSQVRILETVDVGRHVAKQGEIVQRGASVLPKGTYMSPAVVGVLAAVGQKIVRLYKKPSVGILVTGDELVDVDQLPDKGQIRNSNGYALLAQVQESGCAPRALGLVQDSLLELTEAIAAGLENDVLLITGGVSMGELDLVEDVFEKLAVEIFYDKVNIKPGKPTVFGRKNDTLVFGLPGNPVSASTIFEVIVRPCLRKMLGFRSLHNVSTKAELTKAIQSKTKRVNYAPAWTTLESGRFYSAPVPSKGSADIVAFAHSNSYLLVPSEVDRLDAGEEAEVLLRDEFWRACNLAKSPVRHDD